MPSDPSANAVPQATDHRLRFHAPPLHLASAIRGRWFGRNAEGFARFFGTPVFLIAQTALVAIWIGFNIWGLAHFDPYPFILLNLAFSTQAAYAAPLILLAQNRQDDRDRVSLEEERSRAERNTEDTEYLARELAALRVAVGEVATRDYLRGELDRLAALLPADPNARPGKSD